MDQHILFYVGHNSVEIQWWTVNWRRCCSRFGVCFEVDKTQQQLSPFERGINWPTFRFLTRKWKINWKRYSESSSHSGTVSSYKTVESPDWKSRLPRWPCRDAGLFVVLERAKWTGSAMAKFSKDWASVSLVLSLQWDQAYILKRTFIHFFFFSHRVSLFVLTQTKGKTLAAHVHIWRQDIFVEMKS